ncbi:hypothetical protein [Streptomyces sp. NPDC052036]|uniref:hypothetical protein n=1 Tax=Streptomyces sp. NPDC052036 TaxID=3155171 RepID=UPI0034442E7F
MEEQTYNPVLEVEELPKWRLTNPLRPPAPGRALVLVRDGGPSLTVRSDEEIPSSRFGAYRSVFTVDMTEHRLILDIPLLSRDPTFSFRSRVDLVCRVADPAEVVARGMRDMSGALYGYLRRTLRSVARDYDIAEFHEAETALNAALASFRGDDAIRLRDIQIELLVDEDEIAAGGREFRDVVRETRLEGMRRKRHLDMIREEGVDGLIAGILEEEGPRAALVWIEKSEADKREIRREVMRMVLERGDADREPFEQAALERAVLDEVLRDGDGLFETATRRGRFRGSLARALEAGADDPAGPEDGSREREPLRGEVIRDRYEGHADRPSVRGGAADPPDSRRRDGRPGAPRIRVSGPADVRPGDRTAAGPPEDEPLPGGAGPVGRVRRPARPPVSPAETDGGTAGPAPGADRRTAGSARGGPGRPHGSADGATRVGPRPEPEPVTPPAPRVSRVRGTAKRPGGGTPGTTAQDGERR